MGAGPFYFPLPERIYVMSKPTVTQNWAVIGVVGVDSGTLMIGDPCYLRDVPQHPLLDWDCFCNSLVMEGNPEVKQLHYARGQAGLGLVVSTHADGAYPVEARLIDGRVAELRIRISDE